MAVFTKELGSRVVTGAKKLGSRVAAGAKKTGYRLSVEMKKNWILYVMVIPVIIYFAVYHYWPMYGVQIAFKDYHAKLGITGSPWVGFEHFQRFFNSHHFKQLLTNSLGLSVYSLLVEFPLAIVFALLLNYLRSTRLKKVVQTVSYAPHFISTVVLCGMIICFTDPNAGVFNALRKLVGLEPVAFLGKAEWFKSIFVWSGVWQNMGWSAIIYISALAGVDSSLHEAAIVDGASKFKRILHIDLPSIKPTIIMLLILRMGSLMSIGFEKTFLLQNDLNLSSSNIIDTYVYEMGLINADYSYSAAVGLFNTAINVILLLSANIISKKVADESLF